MADAELIGFEIKTARDTLRRLPTQIEAYSRYFDHAVLVVAEKHLSALEHIDLHGASLWTIDDGGVHIHHVGTAKPATPDAFLELMTREERKTLTTFCPSTVRQHYERVFTKRYAKTSSTFWQAVKGRPLRGDHIKILSRFSERRAAIAEIAKEREERWRRWNDAQALALALA
jgi:predicted nucleic acid-binding protein